MPGEAEGLSGSESPAPTLRLPENTRCRPEAVGPACNEDQAAPNRSNRRVADVRLGGRSQARFVPVDDPVLSAGTRYSMATIVRRGRPRMPKEQRDPWLCHEKKRTADACEAFDPE
jgi:hypothetical protein